MAHQTRAPKQIVNNVFPANQLEELTLTHRQLCEATGTTLCCMEWLAMYGLIKNDRKCDACDVAMSLRARGRSDIDGYAWVCKVCRRRRNIRAGSFFEGSRLELQQLVDLIYWWSKSTSATETKRQCEISSWSTMVDWLNFIRDVCAMCLIDHPVQLGGPGQVVEVDESKCTQRKFHRGREEHWVLGMIERETDNCAMVIVQDRSVETLLPIIQQHVLPGTQIITDRWCDYTQLPNHHVNHTLNFVDPTVLTNSVESSWRNCKKKFRLKHSTSESLINSYLQEHIWRRNFGDNPFGNILYWIRHYY